LVSSVRTLRAALAVGLALGVVLGTPASASSYDALTPGGLTPLRETVPVNVVFVGFQEGDVPWPAVLEELPESAQPIVRSRAFYGIEEKLGLEYAYEYRPHYASAAWEDEFFGYLTSIATPQPLTDYQDAYNAQSSNAIAVDGNHFIDAPAVERRLIDTAPPEVDTRMPTVFFINWYGREDFRFHVYTKIGEPNPDTGYDFGERRDSRKLAAWGGRRRTTRRPGSARTAACGACGSMTSRPAPKSGPPAGISTTPTSTGTAPPTTGSHRCGSTAPTGRPRSSPPTWARSCATSG
jgi:hypothetical protein